MATLATATIQEQLIDLQDNMLNFAFILTSNREEARDLLQDTTLKVLDNQGECERILKEQDTQRK